MTEGEVFHGNFDLGANIAQAIHETVRVVVLAGVNLEGQSSEVDGDRLLPRLRTGIPIYGKLADIHGIRPLYLFGLTAFAAGALVCTSAPNLALLLAGRFVQGLGGAVLPGLSMTAVAHFVPSTVVEAASAPSRPRPDAARRSARSSADSAPR